VAGYNFQARPVWIYTQSNITNIIKAFCFVALQFAGLPDHSILTDKIMFVLELLSAFEKLLGYL
jgi:hypothetical protein